MYRTQLSKLGINVPADTSVYALVSQRKDTDETVGILYEAIREYLTEIPSRGKPVTGPQDAVDEMLPCFKGLDHEELWLMLLNKGGVLIRKERITSGSTDAVIIDTKGILRKALLKNAAGIIIAHNHPSGDTTPSHSDITMTEKLKTACDCMGISLLDHIVISDTEYYSFTEGTKKQLTKKDS